MRTARRDEACEEQIRGYRVATVLRKRPDGGEHRLKLWRL